MHTFDCISRINYVARRTRKTIGRTVLCGALGSSLPLWARKTQKSGYSGRALHRRKHAKKKVDVSIAPGRPSHLNLTKAAADRAAGGGCFHRHNKMDYLYSTSRTFTADDITWKLTHTPSPDDSQSSITDRFRLNTGRLHLRTPEEMGAWAIGQSLFLNKPVKAQPRNAWERPLRGWIRCRQV
jgi:hypothetical protein